VQSDYSVTLLFRNAGGLEIGLMVLEEVQQARPSRPTRPQPLHHASPSSAPFARRSNPKRRDIKIEQ
jgi:hypothetical protein